jgi:hypothetical protein
MEIGVIEGATAVAGEKQGYQPLPLRQVMLNCTVNGEGTPAIQSAWQPTTDEVMRLFEGAPIILTIIGTRQPPVLLEVGEPPAKDENRESSDSFSAI